MWRHVVEGRQMEAPSGTNVMPEAKFKWEIASANTNRVVEPLSNDHPHQRLGLSLLYDHILCDGQCFLFVGLRSLTNDLPSDATNDRVRWDFLPRERPPRPTVYFQESQVAQRRSLDFCLGGAPGRCHPVHFP